MLAPLSLSESPFNCISSLSFARDGAGRTLRFNDVLLFGHTLRPGSPTAPAHHHAAAAAAAAHILPHRAPPATPSREVSDVSVELENGEV